MSIFPCVYGAFHVSFSVFIICPFLIVWHFASEFLTALHILEILACAGYYLFATSQPTVWMYAWEVVPDIFHHPDSPDSWLLVGCRQWGTLAEEGRVG